MINDLVGKKVKSLKTNEVGVITNAVNTTGNNLCNDYDINVTIEYPSCTKQMTLLYCLNKGILKLEEDFDFTSIKEDLRIMKEDDDNMKAIQEEQNKKRKLAIKAAEEAKAAEEKYKKKVAKTLEKVNSLSKERLSKSSNLYYALGWLAKHTGSINAKMPDYLEDWFVKNFGDVPRSVSDGRKTSSGGYAWQWSYSFSLTLTKMKDTEIPAYLNDYVKANRIQSVSFIWSLVDDYGFNFGKGVNIEEIRSKIPTDNLQDFDLGFSA